MDNEWNYNEELEPMPEHHIDPEFTPEYPDVTFFKESYVSMREDNIFQGEPPQGEPQQKAQEQQKAKQTRMSWFRKFLGSAMRGGAAIVAASALIVNAAEGDPSAAAHRIKNMMVKLHEDAIEQPSDYTPDELEALWNSDPEAPHQYDYSKLIVIREATCTQPGLSCYVCTDCGVQQTMPTYKAHEPAAPVQEDMIEPDCTHDGSFKEVTYCKVCGTEMSRIHRVLYAPGHTGGDFVVENVIDPNCTENGSEEDVVYCTVCGEEISRTTVVLEALGHTENEPVVENVVDPNCTEDGSEEEVVYCSVCGEEISRTVIVLEALGHTEDEPVIENEVEASCTGEGSKDEVVYCSVCGEEISRTTETTPALGHSYTAKVTAPTCTAQGYTTHTCSRCGTSYQSNMTAALGHSYTAKVTAPTCTAQGYTTHTCSRCGNSYRDTYKAALGHNYTAKTTAATCTAQGYTTHTCSRCGNNYKDTYTAALGHTFNIEPGNWWGEGAAIPVVTCNRCSTPAFTVSFVNATTLTYTMNADIWAQADAALGFFEWGDCVVYETADRDYGIGYIASGYNEATSRTGKIVLDFTPVTGRTYYYKICLRVATSTSSDAVFFVAPQGGANKSYKAP